MAQFKIPFGKAKGQTLDAASEADIRWVAGKIKEKLDADPNKPYADKDRRFLDAVNAELQRRRNGGGAPAQAIQRQAPSVALVESYIDPAKATAALQQATQHFHLVTPATSVGNLPDGCEVQLSMVQISQDDPHLYTVGDKVALDKYHLIAILNAAAGSIDYLRRVDNGSHPHYCACEAQVSYRMFDGSLIRRPGNAEMDVRAPDGQRYVEIVEKAKNATPPRDPSRQLLELRKFLLPQTESRALNRAIANMGVRRSYERGELSRPFMVARVMFTGRSEDPEARKQFRAAIAQSFLGATAGMYGPPQQLPPATTHTPAPPLSAPPFRDTDGSDEPYEYEYDDPAPATAAATPAQQAPQQAAAPPPQQPPAGAGDAWEGDVDEQGRLL